MPSFSLHINLSGYNINVRSFYIDPKDEGGILELLLNIINVQKNLTLSEPVFFTVCHEKHGQKLSPDAFVFYRKTPTLYIPSLKRTIYFYNPIIEVKPVSYTHLTLPTN